MSVSDACGCAGGAAIQQAMGAPRAGATRQWGDGEHGTSRTHGSHHGHRGHHGGHGGGFVRAIRQVLDQLVAQAAGAASDTTATDTAATDALTTDAVTATSSAADTMAIDTTATGATATGATATDGGASSREIRHALHAFIHTLFQTLAGAAAASVDSATGATDADGDGDGPTSAAPEAAGFRFGYRTPGTNLAALASDGGSGGMDLSALQAGFQNLLDAMGAGDSGVTLQSFLQALLDHPGGAAAPPPDPASTAVGTLLAVSA